MILYLNDKQKEYFNFDSKEVVKVRYMENFNSVIKKSIEAITKLFKSYNIEFAFIGGIARNQYGNPRTTMDIDIVVSNKDRDKISKIPIGYMRDIGISRGKVFKFHDPENRLEILYSGEISGDGIHGIKYEEPKDISIEINGIPFISLKEFVRYKLSSGIYGKRYKDFADIQDVIQVHRLPISFADKFREDLKKKYIEIWNDSK